MWILGHLALGYFSAFTVGKFTKEKIIIPLVWVVCMLPDLDELFKGFVVHRGPSHSIIVAVIVFIPVVLLFRRGLPYFTALTSHMLIGDYLYPPTQLFWPISNAWYGAPSWLQLRGTLETVVEVSLFILMVIVILHRRKLFIDTPSEKVSDSTS
jgi:membrane-bound metal-dependent hydrolase YbcI (DUF457 family)